MKIEEDDVSAWSCSKHVHGLVIKNEESTKPSDGANQENYDDIVLAAAEGLLLLSQQRRSNIDVMKPDRYVRAARDRRNGGKTYDDVFVCCKKRHRKRRKRYLSIVKIYAKTMPF